MIYRGIGQLSTTNHYRVNASFSVFWTKKMHKHNKILKYFSSQNKSVQSPKSTKVTVLSVMAIQLRQILFTKATIGKHL